MVLSFPREILDIIVSGLENHATLSTFKRHFTVGCISSQGLPKFEDPIFSRAESDSLDQLSTGPNYLALTEVAILTYLVFKT